MALLMRLKAKQRAGEQLFAARADAARAAASWWWGRLRRLRF
jgi:hypothetical protein